jgi:hypothetical protein
MRPDSPLLFAEVLERVEQAGIRMRVPCRVHGLPDARYRSDGRNGFAPQTSKPKTFPVEAEFLRNGPQKVLREVAIIPASALLASPFRARFDLKYEPFRVTS